MHLARALIAVAALCGTGVVLSAAPSSAQPCDPGVYGCPTTTTTTTGGPGGGQAGVTIELDVGEGEPGTTVRATACGYVEGEAVTITFGGQVVGDGSAGADGCVTVTLVVPDVPPGAYDVCAVAAGRPSPCASFTVIGVLGAQAEPTSGSAAGGGSGPSGVGSLARTGAAIGVLLAVALALLLAGRTIQRRADRGRQSVAR